MSTELERLADVMEQCPKYASVEVQYWMVPFHLFDKVIAALRSRADQPTEAPKGGDRTEQSAEAGVSMTAPRPEHRSGPYPTIERLADLSATTVGYQGPVLVAEAVRCWRELREAQRKLDWWKQRAESAEARAERAEAAGVGYSQQTVNAIAGERDKLRARVPELEARLAERELDAERYRANTHWMPLPEPPK